MAATRSNMHTPRSRLSLHGDVTDHAVIAEFHQQCCTSLSVENENELFVDLSDVTSADTKLVACLLWLTGRSRCASRRVCIQLSNVVKQWIALTRVDDLLKPHVQDYCQLKPISTQQPAASTEPWR